MSTDLFQTVKASLKGQYGGVIAAMLPGGKFQGNEYVCGSLAGGSGDSCKTNVKTGVGSDFATGEKWGDVIALTALAMNCGQEEAALFLADEYHIDTDNQEPPARRRSRTKRPLFRSCRYLILPRSFRGSIGAFPAGATATPTVWNSVMPSA